MSAHVAGTDYCYLLPGQLDLLNSGNRTENALSGSFFSNQGTRKTLSFSIAIKKTERIRAGTKGPQSREKYKGFKGLIIKSPAFTRAPFSLYTVYKNRISVKGILARAPGTRKGAKKAGKKNVRPLQNPKTGIYLLTESHHSTLLKSSYEASGLCRLQAGAARKTTLQEDAK
jgi:hypothetical protein